MLAEHSIDSSEIRDTTVDSLIPLGRLAFKGTVFSTAMFTIHNSLKPYYDQHGQNNSSSALLATSMIVFGIFGGQVADFLHKRQVTNSVAPTSPDDTEVLPAQVDLYDWQAERD